MLLSVVEEQTTSGVCEEITQTTEASDSSMGADLVTLQMAPCGGCVGTLATAVSLPFVLRALVDVETAILSCNVAALVTGKPDAFMLFLLVYF